jgi:putative DNA primase/helicase
MSADQVKLSARITNAPLASVDDEWPVPAPIRAPLAPVPAFNATLLPAALRGWVMDISRRMQCPPDFPAVGAMIGLATIVGRRVTVRPKKLDDWSVVPNLWGMVIGRPSALKTPAISEALKPLHRLETLSKEQHETMQRDHEKTKLVHAARLDAYKGKLKRAAASGQDLADEPPEEPKEPARRRLISMDTTVEKLGELLRDNPRGVLVYRDELAGWFASFERDGREGDRAFYLEAWNGNAPFRYDRIGRGTVDIEAACVSMLGTIQPGVLTRHVSEQIKGAFNDGLAQRFQMMVYPDDNGAWSYVDERPDSEAKRRALAVFQRLDEADLSLLGATIDPDDDRGRVLHFSDAAQEVFKAWLGDLEQKVRDGDEHAIINEHLGKFRSLMPSVAALIHLADAAVDLVPPGEISEAAAWCAVEWCAYLEAHARRIYGSALSRSTDAARLLASKIRKRRIGDRFKARDVYINEWTGLATSDEAKKAIDTLEEFGWLRSLDVRTGGRPTVEYAINPRVYAPDAAAAEDDNDA